jgi:hypothetical protein
MKKNKMMKTEGSFANLPQGEVMKEYPKNPMSKMSDYADNMEGLDKIAKDNMKKLKRGK